MNFNFDEFSNASIEKFESMLKTNEVLFFDAVEFEEIIHHYIDFGKPILAQKAIKIALKQHPSSTEIQLLQSEIFVMEGNIKEAELILDRLFELETNNEEVYIQKANILSKRKEHIQAIELLKKALYFAEEPVEIYSLLGMEYLFLDNFLLAKDSFSRCLDIDKYDYASLYNIVYCFDTMNDHDGAIVFLNSYLDRTPYCEIAWHQLGKQYTYLEMYPEALTAFDFAIICDDQFVGAYLEIGKVLEKLGKFNEAIQNYELTLSLDDPTSFAYLRMGKCHLSLGNEDLALKFFKKTVHNDPLLDKGWISLADFYIQKKKYKKALYYLNKALQIDTSNIVIWKQYVLANEKLHCYEEASVGYGEIVSLGNYELETWINWARVQHKLGDYDQAVITLMQGAEFFPEAAEINYLLSGMYFLLMQEHKGLFYLKNAYRSNPRKYRLFINEFPSLSNLKLIKESLPSREKN